jgi:hypothetical protein
MNPTSTFWNENKKRFAETAIVKYTAENCPSAGYNLIRYADKGILAIEGTVVDLSVTSPYEVLWAAKAGKVSYVEC